MADKSQLHALVDRLPDGAIESAFQYLSTIQTWPPKPPEMPDVIEGRKKLDERMSKFLKYPSGGWSIDRANKVHASYSDSERNWDTGELTRRTFCVHNDFPIEITERFLMKDNDETLEYKFHLKGLGKEHEFVLHFNADAAMKL